MACAGEEGGKTVLGLPQETKKSLELKVRWEMKIVYHFRREDFHPKPSVDSVLVYFSKKAIADLNGREYQAFQKFIVQGKKTVNGKSLCFSA